jgi:hypothetical protein
MAAMCGLARTMMEMYKVISWHKVLENDFEFIFLFFFCKENTEDTKMDMDFIIHIK